MSPNDMNRRTTCSIRYSPICRPVGRNKHSAVPAFPRGMRLRCVCRGVLFFVALPRGERFAGLRVGNRRNSANAVACFY